MLLYFLPEFRSSLSQIHVIGRTAITDLRLFGFQGHNLGRKVVLLSLRATTATWGHVL